MTTIGFLHTAAVHEATFDALVAEAAPAATTVVVVDESLLGAARDRGLADPEVQDGIRAALDTLVARGADAIVCTCSTIAGEAEVIGADAPVPVVRVDRPLAVAAVAAGRRIAVVAALESTLAPTTGLLESVAAHTGAAVTITPVLCADAWTRFEAGDQEGYLDLVTAAARAAAEDHDVVVLAQASMAGAVTRVDVDVPVLASPVSAVTHALGIAGA
jgi:Asp/Glu/hydantoin racemase